MDFRDEFFAEIGKSPAVTALCVGAAQRVLRRAQATAPVDTGSYRDGFRIRIKASAFRNVALVVGTDEKTMLIESKTGNLVRALKAAGRGV